MKPSKKLLKKPNASTSAGRQKRKSRRKAKNQAKLMIDSPADDDPLSLLCKSSPVPKSKRGSSPEFFLMRLLPKERLKCLGTTLGDCDTKLIADFPHPLSQFRLVVPGYMTRRWGLLKNAKFDGTQKWGQRTNDNTAPIRFVVFQSETGPLEQQVDAVERLSSWRSLVMVVKTGPNSIEAWYSAKGMEKPDIHKFRRFAKVLGAPDSIFIDAHPYALPGAINSCGFKNQVIFWNPSAL